MKKPFYMVLDIFNISSPIMMELWQVKLRAIAGVPVQPSPEHWPQFNQIFPVFCGDPIVVLLLLLRCIPNTQINENGFL